MTRLRDAFRHSLRFPRAMLWLLWLFFPLYGVIATQVFLPPDDGYGAQVVMAAVRGDFAAVEPAVIAVFNLLGVIPMTYALLVLFDGKEQPLPAWPFVLLSFVVGSLGILAYLAMRSWGRGVEGAETQLQRRLDSRVAPAILLTLSALLVVWGLSGSIHAYWALWQTKPLVNVMTVDLLILLGVLPFLAVDDMGRRGVQSPFWRVLVALLPLFGVLIYMLARPPLQHPGRR